MTTTKAIHEDEFRDMLVAFLADRASELQEDFYSNVETPDLAEQAAVAFVKHDVEGWDELWEATSAYLNACDGPRNPQFPLEIEATVDEDVDAAVEAAKMAFWREVAEQFPEAESGDLPPDAAREIDEAMFQAVMRWVDYNVPGAEVSGLEG